MVIGGKHRFILAGGMLMLCLGRKRSLVRFTRGRFFRCRGTGSDSAFAAVECDVGFVVHNNRPVHVHVGDIDGVYANYCGVVKERTAAPFAANEANSSVTEAIVDSTIETDGRTPVARILAV